MTDSNRFQLIQGGEDTSSALSSPMLSSPEADALDAQLAAYVDGFLDEEERAEVQARLDADPALAAEVDAIAGVLPVLQSSHVPSPPADMLQKVRARIAAHESTAEVSSTASSHTASSHTASSHTASSHTASSHTVSSHTVSSHTGGAAAPWRGLLWASGIAVTAAAAAFVFIAMPKAGDGASGVNGAGMGFADEHRAVTISVAGADAAQVSMRASEAGLHEADAPLVFEGTDAAVTRFLFALRNESGATVRGFVPEAPKLRLTVQLK